MKTKFFPLIITILLLHAWDHVQAQSTALPFLEISTSPETNGMGGIGTPYPSVDALAVISNPGQLGLFSLHNNFSAGSFVRDTKWLPAFNIDGLTYGCRGVSVGLNMIDKLNLPVSASIGIGYTQVDLGLGKFTLTDQYGPDPIGTFEAKEFSQNLSVAIGVEYFARLGFGWNVKRVTSNLGIATAKVWMNDFGILLDVPVAPIVESLTGSSLEISPNLRPLLNLSAGRTTSNIGDGVRYDGAVQDDPLPRLATLGVAVEAGLTSRLDAFDWNLISFTWLRQADDILVITKYPPYRYEYQDGIGDIRFIDNVILGKSNEKIYLRKGWQLQAAELLSIRNGSVDAPGLAYETMGFGLSLGGVFKLLKSGGHMRSTDSWLSKFSEIADVQFHWSSYSSVNSPVNATEMTSLNITLKGWPM